MRINAESIHQHYNKIKIKTNTENESKEIHIHTLKLPPGHTFIMQQWRKLCRDAQRRGQSREPLSCQPARDTLHPR